MKTETNERDEKDRVIIFDTTLRDGEQCPGATMTFEEKLEVAELLDEMGVDIIEAGFPIASPGRLRKRAGDRPAGQECRDLRSGARAAKDIDRCAEAIRPAARGRIHTFIGTSPLHRKYQMGIDEAEVLERGSPRRSARARGLTDDVEWSAMDATRTEADFLCRCVEAAIKAGATTVNIPDTVGYAYARRVRRSDPHAAGARAGRGQDRLLHPLPQRSGPGRRQLSGGRERGRASGRMRRQRSGRACGQRGAGRDRHGDPHARRT